MDPSSTTQSRVIGREKEKQEFIRILKNAKGHRQCLYKLGSGGIGKTMFLKWCLELAPRHGKFAVLPLIDLFIPKLRTRDGFMQYMVAELERLGFEKEFKAFHKKYSDVPDVFHQCLLKVCKKNILIVAVDTFELVAKEYLAQWLLSENGLLIPNLILVIGSRQDLKELAGFTIPSDVTQSPVQPLTVPEALELYCTIFPDVGDPSQDLIMFVNHLVAVTNGHPLLLELAFNWLRGDLLSSAWLDSLTKEDFEREIMRYAADNAHDSEITANNTIVPWAAFQAIVYMAYMHRHFDMPLLERLVADGYIEVPKSVRTDGVQLQAYLGRLLDIMQRYFFVKVHRNGSVQLQLHDEMARLVETYVLPVWVWPKDDGQIGFGRYVVKLYIDLLKWEQVNTNVLPVSTDFNKLETISEYLAYALKLERLINAHPESSECQYFGLHLFNDLAERNIVELNKLLLAEMGLHFKALANGLYYERASLWRLYQRLGEMETRLTHYPQALSMFDSALAFAIAEGNPEWQVRALIGKHNATWPSDPQTSLDDYLFPALEMASKSAPDLIPTVEYEIGFAYRRLFYFKQAIEHYRKALEKARELGATEVREAHILNDYGYLLPYTGEYDVAQDNVSQGLTLRKQVLAQHQEELRQMQERIRISDEPDLADRLEEDRLQRLVSYDEERVGMSYNTLGEIFRYRSRLGHAQKSYTLGYEIFKKLSNLRFQVRALVCRAEALRRQTVEREDYDLDMINQPFRRVQNDLELAIYLCRKYPDVGEAATAYRRLGRLFHDRANLYIKQKDGASARKWLADAYMEFSKGLAEARRERSKNALEELENAVELAFLLNDWLEATEDKLDDTLYDDYVGELEDTLKRHREEASPDRPAIDILPVFEHLLALEKGAYRFQQKKYAEAYKDYIDGYVGLAQDPGYGVMRYNQHIQHFKDKILELYQIKPALAIQWCEQIIALYDLELGKIAGATDAIVTMRAAQPSLPNWCELYLRRWKAKRDDK